MRSGVLLAVFLTGCGPSLSGPADAGDVPDAGGAVDAGPGVSAPLKVLFIGNSYTYVNDLPSMLARLAASSGVPPDIGVDSVVVGGARLGDHWDAGVALQRTVDGAWTHVVLQGQSLEALSDPRQFKEAARQFQASIVDAGARPTWFVTWARAPGTFYDSGWATPEQMQDLITTTYAAVAKPSPRDLLACVGEAFRLSLQQRRDLALHQSDDSHPSLAGTYLAASTFYVALTGRPVPDSSEVPAGLSLADAAFLRSVAQVGSKCDSVRTRAAG